MAVNRPIVTPVAILLVSIMTEGMFLISPAIQTIADAFPDVPLNTVALTVTLLNLMMIPTTIIVGYIEGKYISCKNLILIGSVMFVVAGVLPVFLTDFNAILVTRVFVGIAMGIVTPLSSTLILRYFEGDRQKTMMGIQTAVKNFGGVVCSAFAGMLAVISWKYPFWSHLIGLVPLVMVYFWVPDLVVDASDGERLSDETTIRGKGEAKMSSGVWGVAFSAFVLVLCLYPALIYMSSIIAENEFGTATDAGVGHAIYTAAGIFAGLVYGFLKSRANYFTLSIGLALECLGLILAATANSLLVFDFGLLLIGISFGVVMTECLILMNALVPGSRQSFALGLTICAMNCGAVVSPYYLVLLKNLFGDSGLQGALLYAAITSGLVGIAATFFLARWRNNTDNQRLHLS